MFTVIYPCCGMRQEINNTNLWLLADKFLQVRSGTVQVCPYCMKEHFAGTRFGLTDQTAEKRPEKGRKLW